MQLSSRLRLLVFSVHVAVVFDDSRLGNSSCYGLCNAIGFTLCLSLFFSLARFFLLGSLYASKSLCLVLCFEPEETTVTPATRC